MDIKDVENLAELGRIDLTEEEKTSLLKDFDSILEYVKTIEKVELDDVSFDYGSKNVWREDEALPREFSVDIITGQFPYSENGFLKVKKIL